MSKFFNRPPRIQPELPSGEIQIPNPPSVSAATSRLNMITMALPLVTILAYSLIGGRGGSPLLLVPMGIAAVLTSAVAVLNWRRTHRQEEAKQAAFAERLNRLREQMAKSHEQQQAFYRHNFPSVEVIQNMVRGAELDTRLWERRPSDGDFGALRMGLGRLPSSVQLKPPTSDSSDAPQLTAALKLADDYNSVADVPAALPLRRVSAAGITARSHQQAADFARALFVHLCGLHSPNDTRLFVIGAPDAKAEWEWACWLPHCNTSREGGTGDQLCFEDKRVQAFWGSIQTELERRRIRKQNRSDGEGEDVTLPLLVVAVDLFAPQGQDSPLENVTGEAAVSLLLNSGAELGAAVVFLVPDFRDVPGECQAVVNLLEGADAAEPFFRYAETGVNAARLEGKADRLDRRSAEAFARELAKVQVRTTYGADLPQALTLLDLMGAKTVEDLNMLHHWRDSLRHAPNWPEGLLGSGMGNKPQKLVFEQNSGSGVHGLVAGTTGTGKSQLLMTMIIGLAVRYDPSVVNFVLVDYKGGTSFDALRKLPHTVDVLTNLHGQAGARAFTAMRAELNRRTELLREARVQDIGEYHERGFHQTKPLPHLFIIIDEFAQMLKERPEFKDHLETIARLGRAPGVHLILATQRPSGVVSEQIRANMKFRICLRVETADDSRELLGRSDAFFLPANVPGRAYMQYGNENLDLIQVAQVGGTYLGPRVDTEAPVVWLKRQHNSSGMAYETQLDVIVRVANQIMRENELQPPKKPWPDPLPEVLPLSDLNEALSDWLYDQGTWRGIDWRRQAMRTVIGRLDNPAQARQDDLLLDLTRGHAVVFGASGWGKTTLLRSVIVGLAATHSPDEFWVYLLDFGGRVLDVLQALPHVGTAITPAESERVQRLLRKLTGILEERQIRFSQAQVSSLSEYNRKRPDDVQPAILLALDNFAEFRENFGEEMDTLTGLARDGRAYGIHIIISAEQVSAIPPKMYSLFTERFALKLADSTDYLAIVGRGVPEAAEIQGRGFVRQERTILEFQAAAPVGPVGAAEADALDDDDAKAEAPENVVLSQLGERMSRKWTGRRPEPINVLGRVVALDRLLDSAPRKRGTHPVFGLWDVDLSTALVDFQSQAHFLVVGPPLSGKTTALRTLALALAAGYAPEQVSLALVDFQNRFFRYNGQHSLSDLPHVMAAVSEQSQLEQLIDSLQARFEQPDGAGEVFVLIDNYDDFISTVSVMNNRALYTKLGDLARRCGANGLHFVVSASNNALRTLNDDFIKQVAAPRYGLALDASDALTPLNARVRPTGQELPPGRGFLARQGRVSLVQVATPQKENCEMEDSLDQWVEQITAQYP